MSKMRKHDELPMIPDKRYFTIGEVSELCGVKSHVLRYWEQMFTTLQPVKRQGNRRYYQYHDIVLIRKIRQLLYSQGYTIDGARQRIASEEEERQESQYDDLLYELIGELKSVLKVLRS